MKNENISATINFYVQDHNKVVQFFEEMGFQTFDRQLSEFTKVSQMYLKPKSTFDISIIEHPALDNFG